MLFKTVFVSLIVLLLMDFVVMEPKEITFDISVTRVKNKNMLTCDHKDKQFNKNKYTVLEGGEVKLMIKFNAFINYVSCFELSNSKNGLLSNPESSMRNVTIVHKKIGTIWNCTILVHKDNPRILPVVNFLGHKYAGVYCYMQIHVRQKTSPQTILVNNMVLEQFRTNLSEKDFDFTAVYEYGDGDIVNVTCTGLQTGPLLKMEYHYADTLSNAFSSTDLSSDVGVGFRAKLHSGHDNTYMICNYKEPKDYTIVMVKFVMKTKFENIISLKINGMILRPKLKDIHYYEIKYEYISNQRLTVECKMNRNDVSVVVLDEGLSSALNDYNNAVTEEGTQAKITFLTEIKNGFSSTFKLRCAADFKSNGSSAETVEINFTQADKFYDRCVLRMDLPSNGTVMELYESNHLKVIYYEFEDGEKLTLKCYSYCKGPVVYLQFKDSDEQNSSSISTTFQLSSQQENPMKACYIKEQSQTSEPKDDKVIREIRVIFRERVVTTTIAPTTEVSIISTVSTAAVPVDPNASTGGGPIVDNWIVGVVGGVTCIVIICVSTIIFKLKKRNHTQGGPYDRNYENLRSQSETSIPPYPSQWESTYAVPVDQRADNATYSVPYRPEAALYSTPIPKSERKKKNNKIDPTYAILDVQNSNGRRNTFKDSEDPNYAEVCVKTKEQCYAKVLPKSERNKKDNNPYACVTNERTYANTENEPEPMYCEPNADPKSQRSLYANVFNNSQYANSSGQEYVEPTYCEPNKRNK